jgi:hypothetical protein
MGLDTMFVLHKYILQLVWLWVSKMKGGENTFRKMEVGHKEIQCVP